MKKPVLFVSAAAIGGVIGAAIYKETKRKQKKAREEGKHVPYGPYEACVKKPLDFVLSFFALIVLSPVMLVVAVLVKIKLGSPVIFTQERPGKDERIFKLYKFRTMSDERDEKGDLLPDEVRLTKFGKALRSTSLDELPELWNIVLGDMSIVGPRPQLVRDMTFMTKEQRKRHAVRAGLSGLAQVKGRNAISWEEKLDWDLEYIKAISFLNDIKIIMDTVLIAFVKKEGITEKNMATAEDFGDYLLRTKKISIREYNEKQVTAKKILEKI